MSYRAIVVTGFQHVTSMNFQIADDVMFVKPQEWNVADVRPYGRSAFESAARNNSYTKLFLPLPEPSAFESCKQWP